MKYIKGNLIRLALEGYFDVIGHGCNCFCAQKSGIASGINATFGTGNSNIYKLESAERRGDVSKLGEIEGHSFSLPHNLSMLENNIAPVTDRKEVVVVNCYTQYSMGTNRRHLDYDSLISCMDKINSRYRGMAVGLPKIGCGLAGGDWAIASKIIENSLVDVDVTIVEL